MASGLEVPEYSSLAKRRRVDAEETSPSSPQDIVGIVGGTSETAVREDFQETIGCDSGFTEIGDASKSTTISPESSNTTTTSSRTDSTSDDTGCPLDTADEKDEVSSTVSNLSDLSGLSELSNEGNQWKNAYSWIQKQMLTGADPRELLNHLLMDSTQIPEQVDDLTLWKIIANMMSEPPRRQKLRHINTMTDVVRLIKCSKKIIVLTGAGVSVSCGIPDFRSRDGIYSRLAQDFPDLPDPQAMFDINYFGQDPRPFFKFAREIYPGQFKPSPCHRFIKMLEKQKKLLRNYSQNIDTLEQVAGIENVIECHGSFATASCTRCKFQVKADHIRDDIFAQRIPVCQRCKANALPSLAEANSEENFRDLVSQGIMKPDIVFFGEGLPDAFHDAMAKDKDECDLLIVIGSSLKVRPVALIPSSIPSHIPQILINREPLPHLKFDVELLGDGDIIINQLCHLLGESYKEVCWKDSVLKQTEQLLSSKFADDSWEQSQDLATSNEFSQENLTDLHQVSTESQDSLMINADTTPKHMETADICISPFHAGHMENVEGSFALLGESPKRPLDDSSDESSPKRPNFGSSTTVDYSDSTAQIFKDSTSSVEPERRNNRVISVQSTSENNGQIYNLEECHVVPGGVGLPSKEATVDLNVDFSLSADEAVASCAEDDKLSDKANVKLRHASIDSALDSGIGDSCNSVDSADGKTDNECQEDKIQLLERRCWEPKARESIAVRLPENSYYQLVPSKYIFPGAEVYSDVEDFDRISVSGNSATSSNSDSSSSSSEDEEETGADDDLSEGVEADANVERESNSWSNGASEEVRR